MILKPVILEAVTDWLSDLILCGLENPNELFWFGSKLSYPKQYQACFIFLLSDRITVTKSTLLIRSNIIDIEAIRNILSSTRSV